MYDFMHNKGCIYPLPNWGLEYGISSIFLVFTKKAETNHDQLPDHYFMIINVCEILCDSFVYCHFIFKTTVGVGTVTIPVLQMCKWEQRTLTWLCCHSSCGAEGVSGPKQNRCRNVVFIINGTVLNFVYDGNRKSLAYIDIPTETQQILTNQLLYTVDLWTMQVWVAWLHLYAHILFNWLPQFNGSAGLNRPMQFKCTSFKGLLMGGNLECIGPQAITGF